MVWWSCNIASNIRQIKLGWSCCKTVWTGCRWMEIGVLTLCADYWWREDLRYSLLLNAGIPEIVITRYRCYIAGFVLVRVIDPFVHSKLLLQMLIRLFDSPLKRLWIKLNQLRWGVKWNKALDLISSSSWEIRKLLQLSFTRSLKEQNTFKVFISCENKPHAASLWP